MIDHNQIIKRFSDEPEDFLAGSQDVTCSHDEIKISALKPTAIQELFMLCL